MHGLVFETSIWLLAGSTRYLSTTTLVSSWNNSRAFGPQSSGPKTPCIVGVVSSSMIEISGFLFIVCLSLFRHTLWIEPKEWAGEIYKNNVKRPEFAVVFFYFSRYSRSRNLTESRQTPTKPCNARSEPRQSWQCGDSPVISELKPSVWVDCNGREMNP